MAPAVAQVLVVDDDAALCRLVGLALAQAGFETVAAAHGGEALALLDETAADHVHPQAILLDMNMPVVDGWAFSRAYHPPGPRLPIIVVTAGGDAAACAAAVGAAAALAKPFDLDDLVACVERQVRQEAGTPPERPQDVRDLDRLVTTLQAISTAAPLRATVCQALLAKLAAVAADAAVYGCLH